MNARSVRRKSKSKGAQGAQARGRRKEPPKPKMRFTIDPTVYVPKVREPNEECEICHKPIKSIALAITGPEGGHCHFDCVLEKLASERSLGPGQKISYLGRGVFGVVETADGKFKILEKISFESSEEFADMKRFVEGTKE